MKETSKKVGQNVEETENRGEKKFRGMNGGA